MKRFAHLLALTTLGTLAACVVPAGQDEPAPGVESEAMKQGQAFTFFTAARVFGGWVVTPMNGGAARFVRAIDLSGTTIADASTLLRDVGPDPRRPVLAFVGRVQGDALQALEVWRAAEPRRLDGAVIHVSHTPQHALTVNQWTEATKGTVKLDLAGSPTLESCDAEGVCAPSYDLPLVAARSKVGLVAVGRARWNGSFVATQWFTKVKVGDRHDPLGFGYCRSGQTECADGTCEDDPVLCHAHTGTGRGQIEAIRFDSSIFRSWLLVTNQTTTLDYVK